MPREKREKVVTLRQVNEIVATKKDTKVFDVALGGTLDGEDDAVEELLHTGFPANCRDLDLTDIGSSTLPAKGKSGHFGTQSNSVEHEPEVVKNGLRVMPLLKKCKTLRSLGLGNNWLGAGAMKDLARILKKNSAALTKLDLAFNNIGDEGVATVATALKKSSVMLRHLDLTHNSIGDKGMQSLAGAFESGAGSGLVKLSLRHNNIGSAGARYLKAALSVGEACPLLRCLKLGHNRISDAGASELAAALEDGICPHLTKLDLANNSITPGGGSKLAAAVTVSDQRSALRMDLCTNMLAAGTISSMEQAHEAGLVARPNLSLHTQNLRMHKPHPVPTFHHLNEFRIEVNRLPIKLARNDEPGRAGKRLFEAWKGGRVDFDHTTSDKDVTAVLEHLKLKPARMFKSYRLAQLHRALATYPHLSEAENRTFDQREKNELHRLPGCYQLPEVGIPGQQAEKLKAVARVYGSVEGQKRVAWDTVLGNEEEEDVFK
jgi:hypothetical protein